MQRIETESVVIGAGIIGMAVALELVRSGRVVHVVDREPAPGGEASGAGAGMLAPRFDAGGPGPFLDLCIESWALWPGLARVLRESTGIDPRHRTDGLLHMASDPAEWKEFEARRKWQESAGIEVERLSPADVGTRFPMVTRDIEGALFYPGAHHLHTTHTVEACYAACRREGVHFIFGQEVEALRIEPVAGGGERVASLKTPRLEISAEDTIVAAGAWTGRLTGELGLPLPVEPVRGQAALTVMDEGFPPCLLYSGRGYIVPRDDGEIFAGSTQERVGFDRNTTREGIRTIWEGARWMLPGLEGKRPSQTWAGLRPGSGDDLPIIGPVPGLKDLWIATGHFRNGILLAPVTGRIIRGWITTGDPGRDMNPFLPDRFLSA